MSKKKSKNSAAAVAVSGAPKHLRVAMVMALPALGLYQIGLRFGVPGAGLAWQFLVFSLMQGMLFCFFWKRIGSVTAANWLGWLYVVQVVSQVTLPLLESVSFGAGYAVFSSNLAVPFSAMCTLTSFIFAWSWFGEGSPRLRTTFRGVLGAAVAAVLCFGLASQAALLAPWLSNAAQWGIVPHDWAEELALQWADPLDDLGDVDGGLYSQQATQQGCEGAERREIQHHPLMDSPLEAHYQVASFVAESSGAGFLLESDEPQEMVVAGGSAELVRVRLVSPAQHTIHGILYPFELQFEHRSASGDKIHVAVLGRLGQDHQSIGAVFRALQDGSSSPIDFARLLGDVGEAYHYSTDACGETVDYYVLNGEFQVGPQQMAQGH